MSDTPRSLLERLCAQPDPATWQRWADLYRPILSNWLQPHGLQPQDVDDVTQDVLLVVVTELPRFRHNERAGAFRCWLREILSRRLREFFRKRAARPRAADWDAVLRQLEDSDSALSKQWDAEHDQAVLRRLLGLIERDFEPATWRAFQQYVLEERPAEVVAADLGLTPNAVYLAKSKILKRLREEFPRGLVD